MSSTVSLVPIPQPKPHPLLKNLGDVDPDCPILSFMRLAHTLGPIYRHRAELTINGDFSTLLGYLQTLQHVPGELRWDRVQLSVDSYPQASVQLTLFTLSSRPETPFN